jgi:hypothetical protein
MVRPLLPPPRQPLSEAGQYSERLADVNRWEDAAIFAELDCFQALGLKSYTLSQMSTLMHYATDEFVLRGLHTLLLLLLLTSLAGIARAAYRRRHGGFDATVERGDQSMNGLYAMYGVATVVFALAVQVSNAATDYKVGIIVMDYAVLSYLFFFNSWFRNSIVFRILQRVRRD